MSMEVDRFTLLVLATLPLALTMLDVLQVIWLSLVGMFVPDLLDETPTGTEMEAL